MTIWRERESEREGREWVERDERVREGLCSKTASRALNPFLSWELSVGLK